MNMEDFVTYEQALTLKELGFIEDCLYLYSSDGELLDKHKSNSDDVGVNDLYSSHNELLFQKGVNTKLCDAPTLGQVQEWLRRKKNIFIGIEPVITDKEKNLYYWVIYMLPSKKQLWRPKHFANPNSALLDAITKSFDIIEATK